MRISLKGLNLIKQHEQLRLVAYLPTVNDVPTIGYGHTKGVKMGDTCTEAQALQWLDEDCAWAQKEVNDLNVILTQNQFDALTSFVFNVGATNFRSSTLRKLLIAGEFDTAVGQFKRWNKQKGVVLNGLTKRRKEEEELFKS